MARKKKKKSKDIEVEIHQLPSVLQMETVIPEKMVKDLNTYLDELLKKDDRDSLQGTLVVQMNHAEQLKMAPEHELSEKECHLITVRGSPYMIT